MRARDAGEVEEKAWMEFTNREMMTIN